MSAPKWVVTIKVCFEGGSTREYIDSLSEIMQQAQDYAAAEVTDIQCQGVDLDISDTLGKVFP